MITPPRSAIVCVRKITELKKEARAQQKDVEPLMNERNVIIFRQVKSGRGSREVKCRLLPF
jgi:hypothetical protein